MSTPAFPLQPLDAHRLPEGQETWVASLLARYLALLQSLTRDERVLYTQTWKQMARHNAPVVARSVLQSGQSATAAQRLMSSLNNSKLLWFDHDLHAVLQCPPFSVLHTTHEVKAFGWERSYACSFVDMPLALLVYGPNVWMECVSQCPRGGEKLAYRVRMDDQFHLHLDAPPNDWHVWLPLPASPEEDALQAFHRIRPRINAFYSLDDLHTQRQYQASDPGVVYTLAQSLYLSECLMLVYRYATG